MQPHLIRKVYSRDGTLLEEWDGSSSKVTSEYVALTMVDMMRGVTAGGGTAAGASAGGHPLAGKTGTVNNHTDVWFIGYTPTYSTGVWMGNPARKVSLGRGMTGGGGAVPFFNGFMIPFMKDKPRDTFPSVPAMPAEIRALMERNRREEREKLARADLLAARSGAADAETQSTGPGTTINSDGTGLTPGIDVNRPRTTTDPPPPVRVPANPTMPRRTPEPQQPGAPEGTRRKGKKGDG